MNQERKNHSRSCLILTAAIELELDRDRIEGHEEEEGAEEEEDEVRTRTSKLEEGRRREAMLLVAGILRISRKGEEGVEGKGKVELTKSQPFISTSL